MCGHDIHQTSRWRTLRAQAIGHFGPICRDCGDTSGPFEVDHILPVSEWPGGAFVLTNLQVLCAPCHLRKHGKT